jgi:transposase
VRERGLLKARGG